MAREENFFDDLARALAEGTLSRGNGPRKLAFLGRSGAQKVDITWMVDAVPLAYTTGGDRN